MKKFYSISLLLACIILSVVSFASCEFDTSGEPDHPTYATYVISAGCHEFNGSNQVLKDINTWIKDNTIYYMEEVNYSTGAPEEFAKSDAAAIKQYEEVFIPKFKAYLEDVKKKFAAGAYEDAGSSVIGKFYVFVSREQGQNKDLKSESVDLIYP